MYPYVNEVNEQKQQKMGKRTKESANIFSFSNFIWSIHRNAHDDAFGWSGTTVYVKVLLFTIVSDNNVQIHASIYQFNIYVYVRHAIQFDFSIFFSHLQFCEIAFSISIRRNDAKVCLVKHIWQNYFLIYEN